MTRPAPKAQLQCLAGRVVRCLLGLYIIIPPMLLAQVAPSTDDGPVPTAPEFSRPQQNAATPRLIDNATIIRMSQAGLEEAILLQTIQLQPGHYDTSPDALIALKAAGVPQQVIVTMQTYGTGLHVRPVPPSTVRPISQPAVPGLYDPVPSGSGIKGVDEIGIYYKVKKGDNVGAWLPLQTERVVFRSSGTLKQVLSQGILGKDTNGYIEGANSPLVLPTGTEILLYTPTGTSADEYFFLRLQNHKDYRDFRTLTGGVFHETAGPQRNELVFKPKKIAPQTYTFTVPADIEKGEYGFLPPGSANAQGIAGNSKIFTFSISE